MTFFKTCCYTGIETISTLPPFHKKSLMKSLFHIHCTFARVAHRDELWWPKNSVNSQASLSHNKLFERSLIFLLLFWVRFSLFSLNFDFIHISFSCCAFFCQTTIVAWSHPRRHFIKTKIVRLFPIHSNAYYTCVDLLRGPR